MTHKNTVKTRRAKEKSAILEETQSQCTVGRRSLLLWVLLKDMQYLSLFGLDVFLNVKSAETQRQYISFITLHQCLLENLTFYFSDKW